MNRIVDTANSSPGNMVDIKRRVEIKPILRQIDELTDLRTTYRYQINLSSVGLNTILVNQFTVDSDCDGEFLIALIRAARRDIVDKSIAMLQEPDEVWIDEQEA